MEQSELDEQTTEQALTTPPPMFTKQNRAIIDNSTCTSYAHHTWLTTITIILYASCKHYNDVCQLYRIVPVAPFMCIVFLLDPSLNLLKWKMMLQIIIIPVTLDPPIRTIQ
jgi:hypothetical protein